MPEKVLYGSAIFKDGQGNTVKVLGLSENDKNKLKQALADIENLKTEVDRSNRGQVVVALKDYYTTEAHKDEMAVGVYYRVPFNKQDQFLEFDPETGKPKNPQTDGGVTDLEVAYFQIVMKNSTDVVNKLAKQVLQLSFEGMATLAGTQTFTGDNTFEKDITVSATQNVDSLGDTKLATAKFVRDLADKKINEAGHLKGTFSNTGEPLDDQIVNNQIAFYAAVDQL